MAIEDKYREGHTHPVKKKIPMIEMNKVKMMRMKKLKVLA